MKCFRSALEGLLRALVQSSSIHLRLDPATDTKELVHLIDRFLDGQFRYPLEWDDFISWKNDNHHVEAVRLRLGEFEPLLFSEDRKDRRRYSNIVVRERNKLAALLGMGEREEFPNL